jgi:diguanylate cyclase (GGDEF)-like protein
MPDGSKPERFPIRAAEEEARADPLGPLVELVLESAGLPADEVAHRLREALPPAIAELVEANRRLRDGAQRLESLVAGVTADLRAMADLSSHDGEEARVAAGVRLRRLADDLDRSLRPGVELDPSRISGTLGARPRILVVDDEPDAREALAEILRPQWEILSAPDGARAVELTHNELPDLVLMDLAMPKLDGMQALRQIRADPATADVPVIFVSARGDDQVKARALDLGAVDYLQKPFSERELRARIERTLRLARSQSALRELAQTDPLTGLANLRAFRARLAEEVKRARRYRTPLTCVMADMDNLKPVNDTLGHSAGDRAIAAVAAVIRAQLRETDFGARYGGDEFVLLLPHTDEDEGRVLAERICARLKATPLELSGRRIAIGASFGLACLSERSPDQTAEDLVRAADSALYRAKGAGRGRVEVAEPGADAAEAAPPGHA